VRSRAGLSRRLVPSLVSMEASLVAELRELRDMQ
jgi:hypothetical protein